MEHTRQRSRFLIGVLVSVLASILASTLALSLVACGRAGGDATPTIGARVTLKVSGSGTTSAILKGVGPAFEADVPGYTLQVLVGSGTGGGVEGTVKGVLDVAAMARPPKEEEAAQGIEYVEFGHSGVALYTHSGVGVTDLTTAQALSILSGETTNWSQVGGPDLAIILYVRDEGDSSTKALREHIFGDAAFPESAKVLTSQADMQTAVAGTVGSVGMGSWPSALAEGADVRSIALDGVAPGDQSYPMVSPIGIGYLSARKADVQPLIDWLLSAQGQEALGEFDVIIGSR
jgi:phosphate transport system substrate-binding protein